MMKKLCHWRLPMNSCHNFFMTPELAKRILELKLDAAMESRLDYLRRGANIGTLTKDEDAEYKRIVDAIDWISILQLKARRFLDGGS
jgi:hypothetical protein